ncbi:protein kinase [bacterium]|nr:protein kinase [bacterium]
MNAIREIIERQKLIDKRYKILQLAGEGYFSYVFRGLDTVNNISVALKFLKEANNAYSIFRFEKEAEALSALSHRHIIKLVQGKTPFTIDYLGHVLTISHFYAMEW